MGFYTHNANKDKFDKLDGYSILESAVTKEAIDINLDGKQSKNMLIEIPDLKLITIDILVHGKEYHQLIKR